MNNIIEKRYDFVYLFDCQDGNPNGDPDMDNAPRFDPETFQGLVSDVCLKRKIRDYVYAAKQNEPGYNIFVTSGVTLESQQQRSYDSLQMKQDKESRDQIGKAREWMCANFFDVRAFGAVMSTKEFNCGQVRGPVQITFSRSADRIFSTEHAITRVAYTKEEKKATTTANTEMGRKHTIAYGLYRTHGFINASFARQTGFTEADLALVWKALCNLFDQDRSAARGFMSARGLYVFEHSSALGEAPAQRLFERITIEKKPGVESPRSFSDYVISVRDEGLPAGVTLTEHCAAYA
jgi:CRISPR-associated protein Csd2